jgi:hypothetical protein
MATEKLKRHKSPGNDQIPAQLIKIRGSKISCEVHKLLNSIWNKEELSEQWKESIIIPILKRLTKQTVAISGISLLSTTCKFYQTFFCQN